MPPAAAAITTNSNDSVAVVVATLDLHGFRKEAAIGKLTVFLEEAVRRHCPPTTAATQRRHRRRGGGAQDDSPERSCSSELQAVWVSVITGTGSHGQHGPVLRNAVKTLLEKRGMSYRLAHGCFTINANSGMVLLPPPLPTDTKVIVVENTLGIKPSCSSTAVMARMIAAPILGTVRSTIISSASADPTPRQVHEDDQLVEHVQQTSMEEFRSLTKKQHEEHVQLNRALSRSQHDEEERRRRLEREEEQAIAQALKKSQQGAIAAAHSTVESNTNDDDDEEEEQRLLQQAMSASQLEFQQWTEEERAKEELELQRILTASRHEAYAVLSSQEEEAQLLQQAISMSLQERNLQFCVTTDENDAGLINHNLMSDSNDCNNMDDEEIQLRRILEQSCQEF